MNRALQLLVLFFLVAYLGALLSGTLSLFNFRVDARVIANPELVPEWIPFTCWRPKYGWSGYFEDKLFNIGMFLPFGVFMCLMLASTGNGSPVVKTTVAAALSSLAIESMQFFIPERHPTASDLLMNTFGGFLGAWLVARGNQILDCSFRVHLNRVFVIIGATAGIGKATALKLARSAPSWCWLGETPGELLTSSKGYTAAYPAFALASLRRT